MQSSRILLIKKDMQEMVKFLYENNIVFQLSKQDNSVWYEIILTHEAVF